MSKKVKCQIKLDLDKALVKSIVKNGCKKGVWSACDVLATASKAQVPLDTGALMNSCAVSVDADGKTGCVSYDTPYAVRQHQVTTYNHQRGRKAKYLEDPAFDSSVQSEMAEAAKQGFESELG